MSLWWVQREQLDLHQIDLIENLPLDESFLILGPPGSGKTNVLLRRAQFVRMQGISNVLVMTFTRPLTEFVKTGCYDGTKIIFPPSCVTTLESWIRSLYVKHGQILPTHSGNLVDWKRKLATGALSFRDENRVPVYDALFIDEAQDLLPEEVAVIAQWSPVLFFAGDDRQRIHDQTDGLAQIRKILSIEQERILPAHYRLAPEICRVADRILLPHGGDSLESTSHYTGPLPATVIVQPTALPKENQLELAASKLENQIRVYADRILEGDRLAVIVAYKEDRERVLNYLNRRPKLRNKAKIIRAKDDPSDDYDPSFDSAASICIVTVKGCKGLEFRALHWVFCDDLMSYHNNEHYYTVVTRAKTSLDIYFTKTLPEVLARAHSEEGGSMW
jgi:superfamily I DNA/RNA helicase